MEFTKTVFSLTSFKKCFLSLLVFPAFLIASGCTSSSLLGGAPSATDLVTRSAQTADLLLKDKHLEGAYTAVQGAQAVVIVPSLAKAGFFVGGSGGKGVFLKRIAGGWSDPAFVGLGDASLGLQFGAQKASVLLTLMTDKAVQRFLEGKLQFGGEISVAAGPIGGGKGARTLQNRTGADVFIYSRAVGLYGGVKIESGVLFHDTAFNQQYYNNPAVTPTDILINGTASNPDAFRLKSLLP